MRFVSWFFPLIMASLIGGTIGALYLAPIIGELIVPPAGIQLPGQPSFDFYGPSP